MENHERLMRRALELAALGRGRVEPNPMVGALLVRDNSIVGDGHHEQFGGHHAEINALARASDATSGATLYVTLEPCCHWGKTGPCTEAVIKAGVSRVVCAMSDPFEEVGGKGLQRLRDAGIDVLVGVLDSEARRLNAPYIKLLTERLPWVHAKWAMTLDGKIATRDGESRWISGSKSREHAHKIRGRMDAIIVGIGTVLADDPLLTARPPGPRTALRVVLDSMARLPSTSQLLRTARDVPTLAVVSDRASLVNSTRLRDAGCECLVIPASEPARVVQLCLEELGRRRMTNVLVEGGGAVLGSFLDCREIDEAHVYVSTKLFGGAEARTPIRGLGIAALRDALSFELTDAVRLGDDWMIHGRLSQ